MTEPKALLSFLSHLLKVTNLPIVTILNNFPTPSLTLPVPGEPAAELGAGALHLRDQGSQPEHGQLTDAPTSIPRYIVSMLTPGMSRNSFSRIFSYGNAWFSSSQTAGKIVLISCSRPKRRKSFVDFLVPVTNTRKAFLKFPDPVLHAPGNLF